MSENNQLSLHQKWEMDIDAAKKGGTMLYLQKQCEYCKYNINNLTKNCEKYAGDEYKPTYVRKCKKECPKFKHESLLDMNVPPHYKTIMGSILGFVIGDVLGVPVEFESRNERKRDAVYEMRAYGTYNQPFGTWSDDTSLLLCLVDSLITGYNINDIAMKYVQFYSKGLWTPYGSVFDIGNTTRIAIIKMMDGGNVLECGGELENDNGNGSLMRILPMAFYVHYLNGKEKYKKIEEVCALTHAHKRSKLACIIYVEYAIQLIKEANKDIAYKRMVECINSNCGQEYKEELPHYIRILNMDLASENEDRISSSGYVVDSLEAVMWCILTTDNYKEAVFKAINLGNDTDTIAALVGGLAGILYGYDGIPENWIQCMARKKDIKELICSFAKSLFDK